MPRPTASDVHTPTVPEGEDSMPWSIERTDRCPVSKPFGLFRKEDGSLVACHASRASAKRQMAAIGMHEAAKKEEILMPYPNEHAARIRNPGDFQPNTFRSKTLPKSEGGKGGVRVIMGRLKGQTTMTAQAYRFPVDLYTAAEARRWLKDNDVKYKSFEAAAKTEKRDEPIFSIGDQDVPYTEMLNAYLEKEGWDWIEPDELQKRYGIEVKWSAEIVKADNERHLVYGVVLKPDEVDSQGDTASADEIEMGAHQYMIRLQAPVQKQDSDQGGIDLQHKAVLAFEKARPVESFIAPVDYDINEHQVPKGSWVMAVHIPSDDVWQKVKKGEVQAFSVRGWGKRKALA